MVQLCGAVPVRMHTRARDRIAPTAQNVYLTRVPRYGRIYVSRVVRQAAYEAYYELVHTIVRLCTLMYSSTVHRLHLVYKSTLYRIASYTVKTNSCYVRLSPRAGSDRYESRFSLARARYTYIYSLYTRYARGSPSSNRHARALARLRARVASSQKILCQVELA
jgi:hypothetical protein